MFFNDELGGEGEGEQNHFRKANTSKRFLTQTKKPNNWNIYSLGRLQGTDTCDGAIDDVRSNLVYIFISQAHCRQFARDIVFHKHITNSCKLKKEVKMSQTSSGTFQTFDKPPHDTILISVNTVDPHFVKVQKNHRKSRITKQN